MTKHVFLNTLTPEEIIKRLKAGEAIKRITDCGEVIYKMIDGIIVIKEGKYTTINECIFVSEDDDHYFEEEEPFEITETGVYRTRDGRKAYVFCVESHVPDAPVHFAVEGDNDTYYASSSGMRYRNNRKSNEDIVDKWED